MTWDAIKNFATNYLFGTVSKAIIYVPDIEGMYSYKSLSNFLGMETRSYVNMFSALGENAIRMGASASLALAESGLKDAADAADATAISAAMALKTFKSVEVQYNPKSLFLSGVGGKVRSISATAGVEAENGYNQIDNAVSTTLSCELVFSNVNISDAFMTEDLMNFNLEAAAGEVANVVKRLMGRSPSVQPQVDGIMSVLTNEFTKYIMFVWGGLVFRGELTRVDANYKMFNKNGDPIFATVNISIRQGFSPETILSESAWKNNFNKTFEKI